MSDFQNGNPPGQNNLDATVERYVPLENDASSTAPKPDSEQPKESGVEVREETKPEVVAELNEAAKNVVEPGSVEDNQQKQPQEPIKPEDEVTELVARDQPVPNTSRPKK